MDVVSVGLLESGSTMPHRGIALPLDPSFLAVAALSIHKRLSFRSTNIIESFPFYEMFLILVCSIKRRDCPSGDESCCICCPPLG